MKIVFTIVACLALTYGAFGQIKTIAEQVLLAGPGEVTFAASMDQGTSQITITSKGPDDRWFGTGFGVTMANADVLIYTDGRVGAMHALGATDYNLNAQNAQGVERDASQDWNIVSNTVAGGVRTIVSTRALNTGDVNDDYIINFADATINIIAARGNSVDYTLSAHGPGNRGSTTLTWAEIDETPPALSAAPFIPADNQIDVALGTNLTATFDENISAGSGNIELRLLSNDAVIELFDVNSNAVFSGNQITLNPASNLTEATDYYVVIPNGAIEDMANNVYAGFTDNSTWNFTTLTLDIIAPELDISPFNPADDQIDVTLGTNLTVTFNEDISAGSGNIVLWRPVPGPDQEVEEFNVTTAAIFSGNQITLNPASNLTAATDYYVTIENGAIEDLAGNVYAGYTDETIWNFTTLDNSGDVTAPGLSAGPFLPADDATLVKIK